MLDRQVVVSRAAITEPVWFGALRLSGSHRIRSIAIASLAPSVDIRQSRRLARAKRGA